MFFNKLQENEFVNTVIKDFLDSFLVYTCVHYSTVHYTSYDSV